MPTPIIAFSKDWDDDRTSNHHILRQLARSRRVLWLNSVATRAPSLGSGRDMRRVGRKLREFVRGPVNVENDLWVFTPLVLPLPESRIVHLVGKTTKVTDRSIGHPRTPGYYYAARRRFLTKNLHPLHAAACDLAFAAGYVLHRLKCLITRRDHEFPSHILRDHIGQSVFLKGFRPPTVPNPAMAAGVEPTATVQAPASDRP